nr:hypothetical protein [Tanacetum cinerariifolium]
MHNNSQGKKHKVEDHRRSVKLSKNKTSVTACVPLCQILHCLLILLQLVEIVLFIVDSGCSKHMTGNLKLLINYVEKFLGTVKYGNDQIAPILRYGDLIQGAITIKREVNVFIRDLKGNDLLSGSRGIDLYSITLQDTKSPNPICLVAKATLSQAWLWHRRLSHLNFDTINLLSKNDIVVGLPKLKLVKDHLCSSCELGKSKRKSFHTKLTPSSKRRLQLPHMDLCGSMRTLHAYFAAEGIQHQTSVARTPEQNGVVKRRNHRIVTTSNELDLLFSLMFDELLNGSSKVVSKSSAVSAADPPNQHQQYIIPLYIHITPAPTSQILTLEQTLTSSENINQAETHAENDQVAYDEFINIFSTPVQDQGETSSRHVDSSTYFLSTISL